MLEGAYNHLLSLVDSSLWTRNARYYLDRYTDKTTVFEVTTNYNDEKTLFFGGVKIIEIDKTICISFKKA